MKISPALLAVMAGFGLTACASIVDGIHEPVAVSSNVSEASCTLTNAKGSWTVPSTPGSVMVDRARGDMNVACHKGGVKGDTTISSDTEAWVFGNIVFGGLIGLGVDMYTGAAYDYPDTVAVKLEQERTGGLTKASASPVAAK